MLLCNCHHNVFLENIYAIHVNILINYYYTFIIFIYDLQ